MQTESLHSVKVFYPAYKLEALIGLLRSGLKELSTILPLRRTVLFGSWAQGNQTAFSDIDLLVVYMGPRRDEAYQQGCAGRWESVESRPMSIRLKRPMTWKTS